MTNYGKIAQIDRQIAAHRKWLATTNSCEKRAREVVEARIAELENERWALSGGRGPGQMVLL
jgi:hypothetical protein